MKIRFCFGSFNNFNKISNSTIMVWSKILNSTKSKLVLKTSERMILNLVKKYYLINFQSIM